jgi:hypothetical protein
MADLKVDGTEVVVRLSALETMMACRRELRLPMANLRMVHVEGSPLAGLPLWRFPGLCWPGAFVVGSCRRARLREFAAAYAGKPALVLEAEGAKWDRVVISHPEAVDLAAEIAALLLGRGPGKPGRRGAFPASLD